MREALSKNDTGPRREALEQTIKIPEIKELRWPVQEILKQMSPQIEGGNYRLIIGDDASGRIPARIFEKFFSEIYRERNFPKPFVRFFAGSSDLVPEGKEPKKEAMRLMLRDVLRVLSKNQQKVYALVVTDTIATGKSLMPLIEVLHELGISFDIASIGCEIPVDEGSGDYKQLLESRLGSKIFWGGINGAPSIYDVPQFGGVGKESTDPFSVSLKKYQPDSWRYLEIGEVDPAILQEKIAQARHDAFLLADQLVEWYQNRSRGK